MAASGVLVAAIAGLVHVLTLATQANVRSRYSMYATTLAAQKIEDLRAASILEPADGEAIEYLDERGLPLEGMAHRNAAYVRTWTATASSTDPASPIIISVFVERRGSLAESAQLVTLRARKSSPAASQP